MIVRNFRSLFLNFLINATLYAYIYDDETSPIVLTMFLNLSLNLTEQNELN